MLSDVSPSEISPAFTLDASQDDQRFVDTGDFVTGCCLLRACGTGDMDAVAAIVRKQPLMTCFKDYDQRTALHVAASEGRLELCEYLLDHGANPNRSDRWGGSPLADAMRHRHTAVARLLRTRGGKIYASSDHGASLILAAARGDFEEVNALIVDGVADVNSCDYDQRSALHLACSEGHPGVVSCLIAAKANVNAEDRWGGRPIDDARHKGNKECEQLLEAAGGESRQPLSSARLAPGSEMHDPLAVDWHDVQQLEKIGAGAFGDIWKCSWRGTLVAAKMLKVREGGSKHAGSAWAVASEATAGSVGAFASEPGACKPDAAAMRSAIEAERAEALADLKLEIGILGQLRHPNVCLLLGYSLANGREVMISELMKCSLQDVLKTARITGTAMSLHRSLKYAIQFVQGMNFLHTCRPPILHRDLKPANLLLDFSNTLKVSDFGLAKLRPISDGLVSDDAVYMTGETGSYRFMAPEVYRHEPYGRPVDVYSFAMILFNMLEGEPPWPETPGPDAAKLAALDNDRPPLPRHWDEKLTHLLRSCWAADPSTRPSFAAALEVLNEIFLATVGSSYEEDLKGGAATANAAPGCCTVM